VNQLDTPRDFAAVSRDISGATTDDKLIAMWLSSRPENTVRAYAADVALLRERVEKPLRHMTAADLIDWAETLARLKPATQYRRLSAVKSLFSYAHKLGYIDLDPAAALRMPKALDDRASKLLSVEQVQTLVSATSGRDRLILLTLYRLGLRESELVGLNAEDLHDSVLVVRGKGGKLRNLAVPPDLAALLRESASDGPLFRSKSGKRLDASAVYRIVTKAAKSANVPATPHTLRHCHASHALEAGAPLHLVRDSLGHSNVATTSKYLHCRPSDGSALYVRSPD
jgi:integrase/recombinase XerD